MPFQACRNLLLSENARFWIAVCTFILTILASDYESLAQDQKMDRAPLPHRQRCFPVQYIFL